MSEDTNLDYKIFDADNHYYESADAFTRYADEKTKKFVRWVEAGKRKYLLFGNEMNPTIQNPTFHKVSKPGAMHENFVNAAAGDREAFRKDSGLAGGAEQESKTFFDRDTEPLRAEYQDRKARLAVMDDQGVERTFMFPTIGAAVPPHVEKEPGLVYPVWRAFNDWLQDDWGYNSDNRIYSFPIIAMNDPQEARKELQRVLDMGAIGITVRPGPVEGRSPADPYFDPFWDLANESEVLIGYHVQYTRHHEPFHAHWYRSPDVDRSYFANLERAMYPLERPMFDTAIALIFGNLFGRFPKLRMLSVENGAIWVPYLLHTLDHTDMMTDRKINVFGQDLPDLPSNIFKKHFWVAPFPEEDIPGLSDYIGIDRTLMGSDWPHPEGNRTPAGFVKGIKEMSDTDVRKIMRDNAMSLVA